MVEWIVASSVLILSVIAMRYMFRNRLALWARYALWSVVALRLLIPFSVSESRFSVLNLLHVEESAPGRTAQSRSETGEMQGAFLFSGSALAGMEGTSSAPQAGMQGTSSAPQAGMQGTPSGSQAGMQGTSSVFQEGMQGTSSVSQEGTQGTSSVPQAGMQGTPSESQTGMQGTSSAPQAGMQGMLSALQSGAQESSRAGMQKEPSEIEIAGRPREEIRENENRPVRIFSTLREKSRYLPWIWLFGSIQCAGVVLVINWRYCAKVRRSRRKCRDCGSSAIPVYVSRVVRTPCIFGLVRPAVYLTPRAVENKRILGYVLCHENTHYRHRDNWWAMVRTVCLCVHWYNPLVWVAAYLSRQDCELACDEETLRRLGEDNRIAYGRSLLEFSVQESISCGCLQLSTTMAGGKKQLKERLLKIAHETKNCKSALVSVFVLAAMALLATFTGGKGGQDRVFAEEDNSSTSNPGAEAAVNPENSSEGETGGIHDISGEEERQETQHCVETVELDLRGAGNCVLQIESDTVPGSGVYQIGEIRVIRQQDGGEDIIQSIHAGDVKALYTKTWRELENTDEILAWNFSSQEEPLFAKSLYSAEDLPISIVGPFESGDGGQMRAYAPNGGILVADLNFDGYNDFCVQTDVGSVNIPYYCFLWNPEEEKFEHGSMIPNVQVDEESRCVKSLTRDGESVYSVKYYKYDENNTLHLVRYIEENQSPEAVFPLLDLTYCESGYYDLPAVDDWDYFTEYGGRMTERFVQWAKQALTELYEWTGTRIETACFNVTNFGSICFANTAQDMRAGRDFYSRTYGERAGFRECIESVNLVTERVVWFSDVTQWNVPENLSGMTDAQVAQWYIERSALAEGEKVEEVTYSYENTFLIRMESGNYYEVTLDPGTREANSVYGPYDSYPVH